ncbi:MAG: esterase [Limisphaerales bacterium]|nr:MAG: esterase [Limisphaerales bacterium]KAG0508905.1 MAG: esterase [Limisphaerales bacterium]TXT50246.1 MAG: esterase [Limisphaerales bacterium]
MPKRRRAPLAAAVQDGVVLLVALLLTCSIVRAAQPVISSAVPATNGFVVHTVQSEFQSGPTKIYARVPDKLAHGVRLPVLYLLPVEAKDEQRWGDPLAEAAKLELANKLNVVCVYPTFSHLPWYCDHPTDPGIRQETYFLKVVVPFVERVYPARAERDARLLLGFSKSGWGAWSLLLRNPEVFGKAAAWDSPMMMERGLYGMAAIAGTQDNFERHRIPTLLRERSKSLGSEPRLLLMGYDNFLAPTQQVHALMEELKIPHAYRDGPQRKHHWNTGWVEEAARWLVTGR